MNLKNQPRLNICMLLPFVYEPNMQWPEIEICSYLTNFGHKVSWVLYSKKIGEIQQFTFGDIYVYAIPYISYLNESSILAKSFNRILNTVKRLHFILKIVKEDKYNLIFVRDQWISEELLAIYIKRKCKIPLVYNCHWTPDKYSAYKKESKKKKKLLNSLFAKFYSLWQVYVLHKADLILPISKRCREDLMKHGIPASKMKPYPEGVNIVSFSNKDARYIHQKYNLNKSKVIIYVGVMDEARRLNILIRAFSEAKNKMRDIKLLMVGDGNDKQNLEGIAKELGLRDDVIFPGWVPHSQIPDFITVADIGVSPVPPLSFFKVSSPTKIVEYMAMGKAVIANEEIPDHKEIIEQSEGGILVPFTERAFTDAIVGLLNNSEKAKEMGRKGREWVAKNRSYETLARELEERYLGLLRDSF